MQTSANMKRFCKEFANRIGWQRGASYNLDRARLHIANNYVKAGREYIVSCVNRLCDINDIRLSLKEKDAIVETMYQYVVKEHDANKR